MLNRLATLSKITTFKAASYCNLRNMSFGPKAAERIGGKTALITGVSSGIGRATAFELADAANGNIRLIITARRLEKLEEVAAELKKAHNSVSVLPLKLDIGDHANISQFVSSLPQDWSKIDVLVNNAGFVYGREEVGAVEHGDMVAMFNTNVLGLIALTQQIVPKFKAQGYGDIVNIGSIAGLDSYANGSIYCASKAAVRSFTHSLRKETLDTNIRVMEFDPGAVETEFSIVRNRGDREKAAAVYAGTEPLVAEDIAEAIVFALTRRQNTVIADTVMFPTNQASASHIYRKPS